MRRILIIAALLMATPAGAGDYALYKCGTIKVLFSMPTEGKPGFYSYQRSGRYEQFRNQKELPRHLFSFKDDDLYYRGKLCSVDDDEN
jgi:hypothetical protein